LSQLRVIIAVAGGAAALALFLPPDWIAIHPDKPTLTVEMGRAWLWERPPPPNGFEDMPVKIGSWWWLIWPPIVAAATATVCVLVGNTTKEKDQDGWSSSLGLFQPLGGSVLSIRT
jgi:hypothetical protein